MKKEKQNNEVIEMLGLIGQVTVTMLVPIFALTFLGIWIGEKIGYQGIAAVIGFVFGAITGMQSVWRILRKYLKNKKSPGQIAREKADIEGTKEIK